MSGLDASPPRRCPLQPLWRCVSMLVSMPEPEVRWVLRLSVCPSGSCRALTGLPAHGSGCISERAAPSPKHILHRRAQGILTSARMSALYATLIPRQQPFPGRIYLFKGLCRGTVAELPCRSLDDTSVLKTYSIYRCPIWICFHSENFPLSGIR